MAAGDERRDRRLGGADHGEHPDRSARFRVVGCRTGNHGTVSVSGRILLLRGVHVGAIHCAKELLRDLKGLPLPGSQPGAIPGARYC